MGSELYEKFMALHTRPGGLVLPNAWDAPSALILADAGFEAIGTSSAALAAILGRIDGRHAVSREEHIAHAEVMARATNLPVNGDFEDGYGDTPEDVAATVDAAVEHGLAGIGIEDTTANPDAPIRDFDDAVARVRAAVQAAIGGSSSLAVPTTTCRGVPTSMTRSVDSPPLPRSAPTCSTHRSHRTSTPW